MVYITSLKNSDKNSCIQSLGKIWAVTPPNPPPKPPCRKHTGAYRGLKADPGNSAYTGPDRTRG